MKTAVRPKKVKFNTLAEITLNKIVNSIDNRCTITGGALKIFSLEGDNYHSTKEKIKEIIETHFNKKASKVVKLNYFNSDLYLCFKKTF